MQNYFSPKLVSLTFGVLVLTLALGFYVFGFAEPSQSPPLGNVFAPLNVGNVGQSKAGGLILNTGGAEFGLIVDKGKVGIGTNNPKSTFDISGGDVCLTGEAGEKICLGEIFYFGTGIDGDATITQNTLLSANMEYNNLTVKSGAILDTRCFILKVRGVLKNQGTIIDTGCAGAGGSGGNYYISGSSGNSGIPKNDLVGGAGGSGGGGGGQNGPDFHEGCSGSAPGGSGGIGGGVVIIYAKNLNNIASINANGFNGSLGLGGSSCMNMGGGGGAGGGGGGNGGAVKVIYYNLISLGVIEAKGGAGGLGGTGQPEKLNYDQSLNTWSPAGNGTSGGGPNGGTGGVRGSPGSSGNDGGAATAISGGSGGGGGGGGSSTNQCCFTGPFVYAGGSGGKGGAGIDGKAIIKAISY